MDLRLAIAGTLCLLLAVGHTMIGVRWVLPHLTQERVRPTPFGPASMTVGMIRVTWFIVTIFASALGGILLALAAAEADPRVVVLRGIAALWVAAAIMAWTIAARRVRSVREVLRLPVPVVWLVVAVLCWIASS